MRYVNVKHGYYMNEPILDKVFPLVKEYKTGKKGGFVTVDATGILPDRGKIRVRLSKLDFEYVGDDVTLVYNSELEKIFEKPVEPVQPVETDEEVIARIAERFQILDDMTSATIAGNVRALIVVGPPGVGKSYGVEAELQKGGIMDDLASRRRSYEVVKGAMTPLGLYAKLHDYSGAGNVLVFDDCDSILTDDLSLNILKAALDSSKKRVIHWNADSNMLRREGIPNKFEFKGAVIFITNLKFNNVRSAKLRDHLEALMSRCHYLDLTIDTMRDKLLRIKQIAMDGSLFPDYGLTTEQENEIIDFMTEHCYRLREVSLRMAIKLADLRNISATRWKSIAFNTCMKQG